MNTRRDFVAGLGAACLAEAVSGCRFFTGAASDFDESLAVFLSDPHVAGTDTGWRKDWTFTRCEFARRVAEVLAMRPLPRHVVIFGDLAIDHGEPEDYRLLAELLCPLRAAGVHVVLGTGNHDRRDTMREAFPGTAKSPVDGRIVSVTPIGPCDLVLLDSLKLTGPDANLKEAPVEGALDDAQQQWIADYIAKAARPTLVAAHHPLNELTACGRPLAKALHEAPHCCGWINGHEHEWRSLVSLSNRSDLRTLFLPSSGLWGDIGSVVFRASADRAVATLRLNDHWFHPPLKPGERKPSVWSDIVADNDGQRCTFSYR